jgi:hypothetical protein
MVPKVSFPLMLMIVSTDQKSRCDAKPDNLDNKNAHRRSHERTDFLIKCFDPGIIWDEHGIRSDVVVSVLFFPLVFVLTFCPPAFHPWIPTCGHPHSSFSGLTTPGHQRHVQRPPRGVGQ